MNESPETDEKIIHLLLSRLERISADSYWAHRASGVRGELLRMLDHLEKQQSFSKVDLQQGMEQGFLILEMAVKEKHQKNGIKKWQDRG